jgi:hypothetical protein
MAIKVKSTLQTTIGLDLQNLILSICGVYQVQKDLVTSNVYYFIDRECHFIKSESISCRFNVAQNELPAVALYNALKLKLQSQGVQLSDIEDV